MILLLIFIVLFLLFLIVIFLLILLLSYGSHVMARQRTQPLSVTLQVFKESARVG